MRSRLALGGPSLRQVMGPVVGLSLADLAKAKADLKSPRPQARVIVGMVAVRVAPCRLSGWLRRCVVRRMGRLCRRPRQAQRWVMCWVVWLLIRVWTRCIRRRG